MVGEDLKHQIKLPGLVWRRDGFKDLGGLLGIGSVVQKNWENVLEKIQGRLRKWKWILPQMSFKGRMLVVNLVASVLWRRLFCIDPPLSLLAGIQAKRIDFCWDKIHWLPQSLLFLSKERFS